MIHSLCTAYHWSYKEAFKQTLPQIIMMNYEAWAESDRWERKREGDKKKSDWEDKYNPIVNKDGTRLADITSDKQRMEIYMKDIGNFDV